MCVCLCVCDRESSVCEREREYVCACVYVHVYGDRIIMHMVLIHHPLAESKHLNAIKYQLLFSVFAAKPSRNPI